MNEIEQAKLLAELMGSLSPSDREQLDRVLADKNAQGKILATSQAQALMNKLFGGTNHG